MTKILTIIFISCYCFFLLLLCTFKKVVFSFECVSSPCILLLSMKFSSSFRFGRGFLMFLLMFSSRYLTQVEQHIASYCVVKSNKWGFWGWDNAEKSWELSRSKCLYQLSFSSKTMKRSANSSTSFFNPRLLKPVQIYYHDTVSKWIKQE